MTCSPLLFPLFGLDAFAQTLCEQNHYRLSQLTIHTFPDEEALVQYHEALEGKALIFLANLHQPNPKILPLLFAAQTARSLGAKSITLVAPYLPYMRQDKVFKKGEGITSSYFASLLSNHFDKLLTIDPHLHRWHHLNDLYTIQTQVLHANAAIADWIKREVKIPVLIGPDEESRQWVKAIAEQAQVPYTILRKTRKGDTDIEVSLPHLESYKQATPILVDDIISSGMTMLKTIEHLHQLQMQAPICIGVHAVFAKGAYERLCGAGIEQLITCNTIPHVSNRIDVSPEVGLGLRELL